MAISGILVDKAPTPTSEEELREISNIIDMVEILRNKNILTKSDAKEYATRLREKVKAIVDGYISK